MADMAVLASWQSWQPWSTTQGGQEGLLKGRMPPNCRRENHHFLGKKGKAAKYAKCANSAITGGGGGKVGAGLRD
ncbi:MAG TPA: hypothetical protein PKD64_19540 [Pirellulaceae bacterium]|nr:hypothetical protein [Pirellulaceae bacterium]